MGLTDVFGFSGVSGEVQADNNDARDGGSPVVAVDLAAADSSRKQRVHHHKRHLSRSSSAVDYAPGNALINELGNPDNMFVTENGTVETSQIGGTAILPCATVKPGTATVSAIINTVVRRLTNIPNNIVMTVATMMIIIITTI